MYKMQNISAENKSLLAIFMMNGNKNKQVVNGLKIEQQDIIIAFLVFLLIIL